MSDATLLMLLNDVRGKTLRLLEGVGEAEARFAPPGLDQHDCVACGACAGGD